MYIQSFGKQEGLKKAISCFLIGLIMTLGFPYTTNANPNPGSTTEKSSQVEKSPIQADKKEGSIATVQDQTFERSNDHFAIIEEFKIDKGFWFTLFGISELARKNEGNKQTAFNFTPIGFSFTGSGFSPTYTQINNGVNVSSIIRDNLTGKLSLPGGKSILIEGLTQTSGGASGNNEIRQGEWEENIKISMKEYTGIGNFEVPVSFKAEPVNKDQSLLRISFESSASFIYSLKSNNSINQKFKGFVIVGAENNKVYFSVFRYEGDCYQYENGSKIDHFVGQQIGYLANPENGKAVLNSGDVGDFDRLLAEYPTINPTSGNFSEKETTPPEWMEKILGMSRFLQVNAVAAAEKRTDFASIATGLGGHIIDGLWSMAFNISSFLRDIASGGQTDAQISEVKNRLFDSKVSFIRNLYDPEKETKGLTGIGPKLEIVDPSIIECYSKIGWDSSGLAGNLLVVINDKWEILKPTNLGKYPDTESSSFQTVASLEKVNLKYFWNKKSFQRSILLHNGYGRILPEIQIEPGSKVNTNDISLNYFLFFQTLEYKGENGQHRSSTFSSSIIEKKIYAKKDIAYYTILTRGKILEPKNNNNGFLAGPIEFSRNLKNDNVYFDTDECYLFKEVLNQTINQLKKSEPITKKRSQNISLDLVGEYFPRKLSFMITTEEISIGERKGVYLIKYRSEPFSFIALSERQNSLQNVNGNESGFMIYSPSEDRVYHYISTFEIQFGKESLCIEEFGYLANKMGKQLLPNINLSNLINLKKVPMEVTQPVNNLPLWVYQGIKVQQIVSLSSLTVGEKGTNPAFPLFVVGLLTLDATTEITLGYSIINDLAGKAAEWIGGKELKEKVLRNINPLKNIISFSCLQALGVGPLVEVSHLIYDLTATGLSSFESQVEQETNNIDTQLKLQRFNKMRKPYINYNEPSIKPDPLDLILKGQEEKKEPTENVPNVKKGGKILKNLLIGSAGIAGGAMALSMALKEKSSNSNIDNDISVDIENNSSYPLDIKIKTTGNWIEYNLGSHKSVQFTVPKSGDCTTIYFWYQSARQTGSGTTNVSSSYCSFELSDDIAQPGRVILAGTVSEC